MNLLDLPDEILLFILKKLNVVDALFRQCGLHSRLDRLLFDPIYVRELDFTIKSWDDSISPMNDLVIDRICEEILPRISDQIIKLTLEPIAFERVLRVVDYPKVSSLSLMNFTKQTFIQHLTDPSRIQLMNKQITQLNIHLIDGTDDDNDPFSLFDWISSVSKCLIDLTYHQSIQLQDLNLTVSQFSSNIYHSLRKLDIQLNTFEECLFLFDGRFPSLSHCVLYIDKIFAPSSSPDNQIKLSKLKHLSLTSYIGTNVFDDWIMPFLQRMSNLEELQLFLNVSKRDTFHVVDGNALENHLSIYLSQLKAFHFSIYTSLYQLNGDIVNVNDYPTNDDLQESFLNKKFGQVRSYVHPSSSKTIFKCHVYSLPFQFKTFLRLSSSFTPDIFTHVRTLAMNDQIPWNYHFFNQVNQCFPFVQTLMMSNYSPQDNSEQEFPIITFDRLLKLHISLAHLDYTRQFLFNRSTHLPRLCQLEIDYEQLITLTNDFTTDPTQFNCLQVRHLITQERFVRPESFSRFFPLL